ncbi:MAG: tRNA 2-thiouridine(34) synthase MnmA [Actinomycetota bacterium]|nr:tRNA 2-thiouridine(34) synthase MnmA [Actinomycetota bacterium]
MKETVAVGLSGGVDSAVVAALLLERGYDVIAITMKLFGWGEALEPASRVAAALKIDHKVVDLTDEFAKFVIESFIQDYSNGLTPNPCVNCNKMIKMGHLLKAAKSFGADKLATGHYVNLETDQKSGRRLILKGRDKMKDQSYMLWRLGQSQLKDILTPLGGYLKSEVKKIASDLKLPTSTEESQEICFVAGNEYVKFLQEKGGLSPKEGDIVTTDKRFLKKHSGLFNFTIGQRKGIGISHDKPLYVIELDPVKNRVVVGENEELYKKSLIAKDLNFIAFDELNTEMKVEAKIRYNMEAKAALMRSIDGARMEVIFDETERAITPGQSVVCYQGDVLIGGGVIEKAS